MGSFGHGLAQVVDFPDSISADTAGSIVDWAEGRAEDADYTGIKVNLPGGSSLRGGGADGGGDEEAEGEEEEDDDLGEVHLQEEL